MGRGIVRATPWLMKGLSIAGTAAMFLVGGGILTHGVPALHHVIAGMLHGFNGVTVELGEVLFDALAGLIAGAIVLAVVTLAQRMRKGGKSPAH